MTNTNDEEPQPVPPARRAGRQWWALAVATGYGGLAWYAKDPAAAVHIFELVLTVLAIRRR